MRDDDTVGRLGGDEFVVLVESAEGEETLNMLADRLTEILREPVELRDGRKLFSVTVSIGVAMGRYDTPDALLRDADLALYSAKAAGKDRYALFDDEHVRGSRAPPGAGERPQRGARGRAAVPRLPADRRDRHATDRRASRRCCAGSHPRRGVILPEEFIPIAEDSGLIAPIGRWALEQACRQAAEWATAGHRSSVAVNVSAQQLGRRGLDRGRQARARRVGHRPVAR